MELTPIEFADKYLHPYRISGDEIIPKYCPFCRGGDNRDTETFALNIEKRTYNCKRGKCQAVGTYRQLLRHFGEDVDTPRSPNREWTRPAPKRYEPPKTRPTAPSQKVVEYLKSRGFRPETWQKRGVGEHEGNIAFPYYENGKLVLMKFRAPRKPKPGEPKAWREKGGKAVFWGMDLCDPRKPLVITEGEMDALALEEAGVPNAVSLPSGAEDLSCVENCWEWLEQFDTIFIWPDNDEAGIECCRKLVAKLGEWRCWVIHSNRKDANEVLLLDGPEAVREAVYNAKEVPKAGLIRLADVQVYDPESHPRVLSSVPAINDEIGGYVLGQLSVWTGTNGSGKSTFLGQELLYAVDQGFKVCAYSGELPGGLFRFWIDLQAAGPNYVVGRQDPKTGYVYYKADPEVVPIIREWYRDDFFLYDHQNHGVTPDSLLDVFEYAARRYNCKVFLVDNLMMLASAEDDRTYYRRQSELVGRLIHFAQKHGVHVHLVAHPRKSEGRPTKNDIAGTMEISNRADNVFAITRVPDANKKEAGCDMILDVLKNRITGKQNVDMGLNFAAACKRFYMPSNTDFLRHRFGWHQLKAA